MLEGKFKCIEEYYPSFMKKGNVYMFEDGRFKEEDGSISGQFTSLEDFNENCATVIIPYTESFTKSDLKDGDYVTNRSGMEYIISLKFERIIDHKNNYLYLGSFYHNLKFGYLLKNEFDIMKVERDGVIIWEREEKSKRDIEIDDIQAQIEELSKKLDKLRKVD